MYVTDDPALFDKILCSRGERQKKQKAYPPDGTHSMAEPQSPRTFTDTEKGDMTDIQYNSLETSAGLAMTYLTATRGFVIRDSWLYLPVSKRHHPHPRSRSIAAPTISNVPGPSSICLRLLLSNIISPPNASSYPRYLHLSFCPLFGPHTRIDGHLAPPQPRYSASDQACLNFTDCSPASACPKTREPTCKRFESDVAETPGNMYIAPMSPVLNICF